MNLSVGDYVELGNSALIKILRENLTKEPYTTAERRALQEWGKTNLKEEYRENNGISQPK